MFKWLRDFFTGNIQKTSECCDSELSDHVTHWSNKSMAAPQAKTVKKKVKSHTKAQLTKMTKIQLEELGREHGIELDRRLVKSKLISQLHKAL